MVRFDLRGAIESRIRVHVVLKSRRSASAEGVAFVVVGGDALNIVENCDAVSWLIARVRRTGSMGLESRQGIFTVKRIGK